ncbi:ubiquitin-conjugating enzyme E2 S [[Emmonsia] crescens]|uniref:Ubiquitin-conjugating enzyme E2 S n=1 Tax=[Emmonsia] crescens TaxID=73230 RepID=A0A0G2IDC9_9EURO|nr:ubiquitin-conjugating enzyme E2 S [Emmonsia crescens UAMH 3008]
MRRLTSDHASLHNDGMPPHYLFPPTNTFSSFPDDLTQLTVFLTGPQGTPYSQGLWQLHLRMPGDYPRSPPKAAFKTRIWHPNVDESTGAVCVDTLKRDWEAKLTLRDVLITISCLLIHPNPDSALNSAAGSLLQDDYEAFAHQAKLMTSIHAPIPKDMKDAVMEAKKRGDESGTVIAEDEDCPATIRSRKTTTTSSLSTVIMKKPAAHSKLNSQRIEKLDIRVQETSQNGLLSSSQSSSSPFSQDQQLTDEDESDTEDTGSASKENDPSLSASPVTITPSSPRKSVLGKRPLAVLANSGEPELVLVNSGDADVDVNAHIHDDDGMTPSERNIAANAFVREQQQQQQQRAQQMQSQEQQPRKSPKLSELSRGVNASGRVRDDYPDQASNPEHNTNKYSRNNSSSQVDRGSRQSSVFSAPPPPPPPQPLLQSSNEKRSDGGKENEVSSTSSIIPASITPITTGTAMTTATATSVTDIPQQQRQKQTLPPSSPISSGSLIETSPPLSSTPASNKTKAPPPPPPLTSSISIPKPSNNNNNNLTARRVSSATAKAKPRVGLRRL